MTLQNTNRTSIMASFATLKSLSDAKKYQSPYQILREFINYIIVSKPLYSFSAVEMKNCLSDYFSFSIPEAVVKTALKNMPGASLAGGIYTISKADLCSDELFEEMKKEADEYETRIIRQLSDYISSKVGDNTIREEILSQELTSFLVEDVSSHSMKYSEFISEFVIKNEQNQEIQEGLNKIRQGSILYIGLSHSIVETGSIVKPLTLYLGTEILFSLMGYNGEIFKQVADDFMIQVRTANSMKAKKIILHYFSEIKKEIDEFFGIASEIVEGKRSSVFQRPAMKAITDGCNTAADVDVKQSDFYYRLQYTFGITEDPQDNYYSEENFTSNLESFDYDDEDDKRKKKETAVMFISHINKLRHGARFSNDLDSEHIIVTNAKATLLISQELSEEIKVSEGLDKICNFAISLDRIISLIWYKLGNGFSKKDFPFSVNAALKARIVLSANIAKNADKEFARIKKEYAERRIDDAQAIARIITLRNKPVLPEDLQGEDIDEIMNFTPEYLSRYEEAVKTNQKNLKEKDEMIESLKANWMREFSKKDEEIAMQATALKDSSKENALLRDELNKYHEKDAELSRKKKRRRNIGLFILSIAWKIFVLVIITTVAIYLEDKCKSKIPMYISWGINVFGTAQIVWCAVKKDKKKYLDDTSES